MLNHECDITKLLNQVEALTAGAKQEPYSELSKKVIENYKLINGEKGKIEAVEGSNSATGRKAHRPRRSGATKKTLGNRSKTNQEALERLAKAKKSNRRTKGIGWKVGQIIKNNANLDTDALLDKIYEETETSPTDAIDDYLIERIDKKNKLNANKTNQEKLHRLAKSKPHESRTKGIGWQVAQLIRDNANLDTDALRELIYKETNTTPTDVIDTYLTQRIDKKKQLDAELAEAKALAKEARQKLIKTNQEILDKLSKAKPRQKKGETLATQISKIIRDNIQLDTDALLAKIYTETDTTPTDSIAEYLTQQINFFKTKRKESIRRQIKKASHPREYDANKQLEKLELEPTKKGSKSKQFNFRKFVKDNINMRVDELLNKIEAELNTELTPDNKAKLAELQDSLRAKQKEHVSLKREKRNQLKERQDYKNMLQKLVRDEDKAHAEAVKQQEKEERQKYQSEFKQLIDSDAGYKEREKQRNRQELEDKLAKAIEEDGHDPNKLKRAFQQVTGLAYLGDGDMKEYLARINDAKKLDGYEKTKALAIIQRDLAKEVPTLWSNSVISWVKMAILANPASALRDAIGTITEGNMLSGGKLVVPTVRQLSKYWNEAMLGIDTSRMAGNSLNENIHTADYSHTAGTNFNLPPAWKKRTPWLEPVMERMARINAGMRDSVAKAVYEQVVDATLSPYDLSKLTDAERIAIIEHAHMRGAMATYSHMPHMLKSDTQAGFLLAGLEKRAVEGLARINGQLGKFEANKQNSKLQRYAIGALRVIGNSTVPFAGFIIRLNARTLNFATAPAVAFANVAGMANRAYQAKSLKRKDLGYSIEDALNIDASFSRGLASAGSYALLIALIESGAIAFDDSEDDAEKRKTASVGLFSPQLNLTQILAVITGNTGRSVQENDLLLSLGAFPMTSIMVHLASGIRKGFKEGEIVRQATNGAMKAFEQAVVNTPANQTLNKLLHSRNEEGERDTSEGLRQLGDNLAKSPIPQILKKPIEILILNPKTKAPTKTVSALPLVRHNGEVARPQAKHERERELADDWGYTAYNLYSLANQLLNPFTAELQTHQKAMVSDYNRNKTSKGSKDADPLSVSYYKYLNDTQQVVPSTWASRQAKSKRIAKFKSTEGGG